MDILINENFDVELDDRNDLAVVTGRRSVEQELALLVNKYFYEEIGSTDETNAIENIALHTQRVVRESDAVESVENISVERQRDGTLEVYIEFDLVDSVSFIVG